MGNNPVKILYITGSAVCVGRDRICFESVFFFSEIHQVFLLLLLLLSIFVSVLVR